MAVLSSARWARRSHSFSSVEFRLHSHSPSQFSFAAVYKAHGSSPDLTSTVYPLKTSVLLHKEDSSSCDDVPSLVSTSSSSSSSKPPTDAEFAPSANFPAGGNSFGVSGDNFDNFANFLPNGDTTFDHPEDLTPSPPHRHFHHHHQNQCQPGWIVLYFPM